MLHNLSLLHISPRPNKFCNQGLTVPYRIDSDDSGGNNDDDIDDIDDDDDDDDDDVKGAVSSILVSFSVAKKPI